MSATIAQYMTYGLIMCLTLLLEYDLLPISPFLILYLIHGFDCTANPTFIHQLAPDSYNLLSTWPPTSSTDDQGHTTLNLSLGSDLMNLIFMHIPDVQVWYCLINMLLPIWCLQMAHLSMLSIEGIHSITPQLQSGILFNLQHYHCEPGHSLLNALTRGFNYPFTSLAPGLTFTEAFLNYLSFIHTSYIRCIDIWQPWK